MAGKWNFGMTCCIEQPDGTAPAEKTLSLSFLPARALNSLGQSYLLEPLALPRTTLVQRMRSCANKHAAPRHTAPHRRVTLDLVYVAVDFDDSAISNACAHVLLGLNLFTYGKDSVQRHHFALCENAVRLPAKLETSNFVRREILICMAGRCIP